MSFRWINPQYADLIRVHRLDDWGAVMSQPRPPRAAQGSRSKDILRFHVPPHADHESALLVKREHRRRWNALARRLVRSAALSSGSRHECNLLLHLAQQGILAPRPVACREGNGLVGAAYLAVLEPADAVSIAKFLHDGAASLTGERRDGLFRQAAVVIARCHAAGVVHGQLTSRNLRIRAAGDGFEFFPVHWQEGRRTSQLTLDDRAADLAALVATLPPRCLRPSDERALVDAYLEEAALVADGPELRNVIARHQTRLLRQRKTWELRESAAEEIDAAAPLEPVETDRMWVDRQFRNSLASAGLDSFSSVMQTTRGRLIRALEDRENWRLELHDAHGIPAGAYLKKHHVRTPSSVLRAKLGVGPGCTAGRAEARSVSRLARGGVGNMRLIAFGEKLHRDGRLESFVLTEELHGYQQLDYFLKARFPTQAETAHQPRSQELGQLVLDVADVAARFHRLGYNHRDLYCCHMFVLEPTPGKFKVNLIDLQRVEHRRWLRSRWIVKDLAQLAYSAPRAQISNTRRMAFAKRYLGVERLTAQHKRLLRRVLAKQRRMERSLGLHP